LSSTAGYKAWAVEGHRTVGLFAPGRAVNPIRFGKIAILSIPPSPCAQVLQNSCYFKMMEEKTDLTGAQVIALAAIAIGFPGERERKRFHVTIGSASSNRRSHRRNRVRS
jgi:hypothetical protein